MDAASTHLELAWSSQHHLELACYKPGDGASRYTPAPQLPPHLREGNSGEGCDVMCVKRNSFNGDNIVFVVVAVVCENLNKTVTTDHIFKLFVSLTKDIRHSSLSLQQSLMCGMY